MEFSNEQIMEYQELKLKCNSWKRDSEELRKVRLELIKLIPDEIMLQRLRSLKKMKGRVENEKTKTI